jgi:hypothetical protein
MHKLIPVVIGAGIAIFDGEPPSLLSVKRNISEETMQCM